MAERSAEAIVAAVEATGLLSGEDGPILLMCSAGRDSHCLLDVAVRLRGAGGVRVLHVDHGLRGAEAAELDAANLLEHCAALGVEVAVQTAEPRDGKAQTQGTRSHRREPAAREGGNLHAWARRQRQALAAQERERTGASLVATAHTRTDLVETAVMRLATQPGRRALLAMRDAEEHLVRPLLGLTRDETGAYCRARGITWRDDPSNADAHYARARVRHGVMPVLRSLNGQAEATIARTLTELAEERAVLDDLVDEILRPPAPAGERGAGRPSVALVALAALPRPLGRLVLRELCERSLGRRCPRAGARLADVLALESAAARGGLASVDLGDGARAELHGGIVRCADSFGVAAPRPPAA